MSMHNIQRILAGGIFHRPLMVGELNLTDAYVDLLPRVRNEDGSVLAAFADGATDGWAQQSNEEEVIAWNTGSNPSDLMATMLLPPDLDPDEPLTLHFVGAPSSDNDSPVMTVEAYIAAAGAALGDDADCGGESEEFAASTDLQHKTLDIAAADLPSDLPALLTLVFHPKDGQLGTDDFYLAGFYATYKRKL
ncbi:MAG: hypothetical protein ACOC7S_00810 [Planctomycetota bacterium]